MRLVNLLIFLFAVPIFAEPVEIMYYDFFGDYLVENSYTIDITIQNASLKEIKEILAKKRNKNNDIDSDLVVIGYGPENTPSAYFAASNFTTNTAPLKAALANMPTRMPNAKWYVYYVNKGLSAYVRKREDHHWSSPFRWLANIGLQDLQYFGSAR